MPCLHLRPVAHRRVVFGFLMGLAAAAPVAAQTATPPAYVVFVQGDAVLERDGEITPAALNMPFVPGDRIRTGIGRVQIAFPDGTAIEVAEDSEVECVTPSRVRLLAGTMDHVQVPATGSQSGMYLPSELDMYGQTLDENGSWQYDTAYGYVWYPTVASTWRPYYNGYWSPVKSYGLTWVGADGWSWPTHHYGRWGYTHDRWFWIPGRTWGPGWVSWGSAPGYVGWCPLGFDGRPVFALSPASGTSWRGWTVMPRTNFGTFGYYANQFAVDGRRLPTSTPFIVHNVAPSADVRSGRGPFDNTRTSGQPSSVAGRQAPAGSRPLTAIGAGPRPSQNRPPVDAGRRVTRPGSGTSASTTRAGTSARDASSVGIRQAPTIKESPSAANPQTASRQLPVELHRQTADGSRFSTGDRRVPTHYGIGIPRTPAVLPAAAASAPGGPATPAAAVRPLTPGYGAANGHAIERAEPGNAPPAQRSAMPASRSNPGPAVHAGPPPAAAPPGGTAAQGQGGGRAAPPGRPR